MSDNDEVGNTNLQQHGISCNFPMIHYGTSVPTADVLHQDETVLTMHELSDLLQSWRKLYSRHKESGE